MANTSWGWTAAVTATVAAALAGCGRGGDSARTTTTPAVAARPVDLDPAPTGRQLLRLERSGHQMGAHDVVKFGSDRSAVVIQAYGGGGEVIKRCTLSAAAFAGLRADLARLPLGPKHPRQKRPFVSMYIPRPAQYVLVAGATDTTFAHDTMPTDARPLVRLLEDTIYGHAARCATTYRSRVS